MKHYLLLLQSEPILKRLSIIQLIAYFGAWFSNVAIYTLLLDMQVSATVIAFTAALHFFAGILQAPFSGPLIDRSEPKKLMLFLTFIEICATLLLLLVTSASHVWFLFVLIFIRMAAASFYFTVEMSLLPKILGGDKLQKANEIHSIIWSLSYTFGMALSGFVVYWLGVKIAFILDALMFVAAFYLLYTLELNIAHAKAQEKFFAMMQDTFVYLKKYPHAIHLMLMHAFVGLTAFDALVALMVDHYYASIIATSLALGLLNAFRAIGLVFGPMVLGKWVNNRRLVWLFMLQGCAIWLWAFVMEHFYLSLAASICVGFFTTTLWSYTYTLLQKNIDEKYYGRIVAYNDMLFLISAALTSLMIGFFASRNFSLEFITSLLGVGFVVGGVYFYWIAKNIPLKEAS